MRDAKEQELIKAWDEAELKRDEANREADEAHRKLREYRASKAQQGGRGGMSLPKPYYEDSAVQRREELDTQEHEDSAAALKKAKAEAKITRMQAEIQERKDAISIFIDKHGETTFDVPHATDKTKCMIVSKDPTSNNWRVTTWDEKGPVGHTGYSTYEKAVYGAVTEFKGDLAKARISTPKKAKPEVKVDSMRKGEVTNE